MEVVAFMDVRATFGTISSHFSAATSPVPGWVRGALHSVAFAPQEGFRHYLRMQYADQTFKGLYHWNFFDACMLIPYFAVMILLSFYGIHRYTMCYHYFKYRRNYQPEPPRNFDELPYVTVQLPIFNEQFVIDRLIEAVCALDYPREKLEIQVLDDSTDETQQVASSIVERYAALGHNTAIRQARSMPASKWPKVNLSPSSMPTSFHHRTG
jgi:hypothetical protein